MQEALTPPWIKIVNDGIEVSVLLQPRASRNQIVGEHDGRLKIALSAPPVDGEANAALIEFFARLLKIKKSDVTLTDGPASRRKRLHLRGVDAATLHALVLS